MVDDENDKNFMFFLSDTQVGMASNLFYSVDKMRFFFRYLSMLLMVLSTLTKNVPRVQGDSEGKWVQSHI